MPFAFRQFTVLGDFASIAAVVGGEVAAVAAGAQAAGTSRSAAECHRHRVSVSTFAPVVGNAPVRAKAHRDRHRHVVGHRVRHALTRQPAAVTRRSNPDAVLRHHRASARRGWLSRDPVNDLAGRHAHRYARADLFALRQWAAAHRSPQPGEGQIRFLAWKATTRSWPRIRPRKGRYGGSIRTSRPERRARCGRSAVPASCGSSPWLSRRIDGGSARLYGERAESTLLPPMDRGSTASGLRGRASSPAFLPEDRVATVVNARLTIPCGGEVQTFDPDTVVIGPVAFAAIAHGVHVAERGMVELWRADLASHGAQRLSSLLATPYAPSIAPRTASSSSLRHIGPSSPTSPLRAA